MFERVGLGWVGLGGMLRGMYGKGLVLRLFEFAMFLLSESKSVNTEPCHQVALQSFFLLG